MGFDCKSHMKRIDGDAGYVLEDVPHLTDYISDLPTYSNPLQFNPAYSAVKQYFVNDDDTVAQKIVVHKDSPRGTHFRRAGPRQKVYFHSDEVHACIVTCGGLCPGLNTVIREIVCGLYHMYGVTRILGIDGGYRGFYSKNTISLTPKVVNDIHKRGGTILGTSRGGHDTSKIVDSIQDREINEVYILGGDGTQRGAAVIYEEIRKRGLKVAVAGIPKTIDNDIPVIDKSFGFDTAVEEAQRAINAAHVEAESTENGIGLVKLMGRYSGFIAMYATLASRDVDCCLIPESPFYLEGKGGLFEFIEKRLKEFGHMVIVIAEGAGQDLLSEGMDGQDASGNKLLKDVGWDQTAGWPVMIIPITIAYFHHKNTNQLRSYSEHEAANSFFMKPCVYVPAAILGIILGLNGYIYAYSVACLPVSTASLILATQLAFTALFALLLVKQKFTPYSINSVVVLTIGASVLALHTSSDKPNNESTGCTIGMLVNNNFKVISREAREYELGEAKYYMVMIGSALTWQCYMTGAIGVVFCHSSLLSCIISTVLLPVTEILGVIFFHEKVPS
ncbi:ATP-dependent 6-phosphofructokinase 6-like [Carica papaya]|uniref:ATP-dependent 6-phosphofructokinase 6-like n=1 Tax=Carica papaya TaxID=3649 RepID=UPI000B8CC077|nr:ATP-dependent 6-phosphofructokinase 6-like [Carica papaya]